MKKILIIVSILVGLITLIGCQINPTEQDSKSEDQTDTSTSTQIIPVETDVIISSDQEVAMGGDSKMELLTKHEFGYYGVDMFVIQIVGIEKFNDWKNQFEGSTPGGRSTWEANISNAVIELNVPKEDFIKANNGFIYTEEQIEAIYSGDPKLINKVFVNEYALLLNDNIYTADWLASRTARDYVEEGITEEVLSSYLDKINVIDFKDEFLAIKGSLKKKEKADPLTIESMDSNYSKIEQLAPYQLEYYGLDSFLYDIVEREKLTEWMNQFVYQYNYRSSRPISESTVINLVKELKIPKEDFIKANNGLIYTNDQIEAIYSGDKKQINKAFVNEYALLINDHIYTAEWFKKHTIEDYKKVGITEEVLEKYLKKINIPELQEEYAYINSALKKMKEQ